MLKLNKKVWVKKLMLDASSRGQPLCFSLLFNNSATLGKIKTFQFYTSVYERKIIYKITNFKTKLSHQNV